jgi:pimeloyl-ACP methyl ester carboxylesterase
MDDDYDPRRSVVGTGRIIVLIPGMDGTGDLFYRQVPLLARSYRVVTYALRESAPAMETLVSDLAGVIDSVARGDEQVTLLGESFGGAVALSFALARPARVERLVILNSFPYFAPQLRLRLAAIALRALPWGAMGVVRRLTAFRLHSAHTHRAEVRRFLELTARTTRAGYLNRLTLLRGYDVRSGLRDLRPPVLFLAADRDHLVPSVAQARYMAASTPRSVVRVLEGHGHICLIAPDIDLEQILDEWSRDFATRTSREADEGTVANSSRVAKDFHAPGASAIT